jgi:Organic solvent tolerance protein.
MLDWSKASDSLVLRDIPGEIITIGTERAQNLQQSLVINSVYNNLSFKLEHEGYQALNPILTNGYKKSPIIAINYFKSLNNFTFSQNINVTYFKAKSIHGYLGYENTDNKFLSLISNPLEGRRTFSSLRINNHSYLNGYKIASTIGIQTLSYNLDNSMQKTNSVAVPNLSIDISSLFVNKIDEAIHLIKPKIFYGYVGYKDQSMNPVFDSE